MVRPARLQVPQLRGRGRDRDRAHLPQRLAQSRPATTSPATPSATTSACTTSATPMPARCCRVKGSDTLAPLGPGLVTDWDFRGKRLRTYVNGAVAQDGSTDEMQWDMHYLVADIARTITLLPGDVLLSGTPANSRPVQPGDVVEVEVEGLGRLTNHIVAGPGRYPGRRSARSPPSQRGGRLHRARRRLGVPRHPAAHPGLIMKPGVGRSRRAQAEHKEERMRVVVDTDLCQDHGQCVVRSTRGLPDRPGHGQAWSCRRKYPRRACGTRSRKPPTSARCRPSRSRADFPFRHGRRLGGDESAHRDRGRVHGGLRAAEQLRAGGHAGAIVAYSATSWHTRITGRRCRRRPCAGPSHEALAYRLKPVRGRCAVAARRPGNRRRPARANGSLATGEQLSYDALVAATGVSARRLPLPVPLCSR